MKDIGGANTITLDKLEIGNTAVVSGVEGKGRIGRRLMEMGLVPGAKLRVVKAAPFGDPIEIRLRGYNLALRRSEAAKVRVTTT